MAKRRTSPSGKPRGGTRIAFWDLKVVPEGDAYALVLEGVPILTYLGRPLTHRSRFLLEQMVGDFDRGEPVIVLDRKIEWPRFESYYFYLSLQRDWIETGTDDLTRAIDLDLSRDPLLLDVAGPERVEQLMRYAPVHNALDFDVGVLQRWAHVSAHWDDESASEREAARDAALQTLAGVKEMYLSLRPEVKTAVMALNAFHDNHILAPMMFAMGRCTSLDYSRAVAASRGTLAGVFPDATPRDQVAMLERVDRTARRAMDFMNASSMIVPATS